MATAKKAKELAKQILETQASRPKAITTKTPLKVYQKEAIDKVVNAKGKTTVSVTANIGKATRRFAERKRTTGEPHGNNF